MGRVKLQLKKIEDKHDRQISFANRKKGLLKKAFELSTLCDVEIALIIFSPSGELLIFDGNRRAEDTIKHYIDLTHQQCGRHFVKSSSGIKSVSEAEYLERTLKEALRRVSLNKGWRCLNIQVLRKKED
ncbi:hypothetical protein Dsin_016630 [Dipteronia sinensis]|uniref:MADS-box domain-containing protein n=1 Tax=Dipteronia sinensis TaxID=43782 RepID=A0AAE0E5T1_9ROSI|nr:hypothetical protein Dsin_016630 [Dipteronia sinensis]